MVVGDAHADLGVEVDQGSALLTGNRSQREDQVREGLLQRGGVAHRIVCQAAADQRIVQSQLAQPNRNLS